VEWAILNGLKQTGVTIMRMEEGLDSGPILLQIPHDIDPAVTGGELSEHLSEMGAQALVEALALFDTTASRRTPRSRRARPTRPSSRARRRTSAGPIRRSGSHG